MKNEKLDRLGKLFMITFSISAVTNGGWAIISSMKSRFVDEYKWLSDQEMVDFISMAQSAPGPIAVMTTSGLVPQTSRMPFANHSAMPVF